MLRFDFSLYDRFGPPLTPEDVGHAVVSLSCDPAYHAGATFGISGRGLAVLENV